MVSEEVVSLGYLIPGSLILILAVILLILFRRDRDYRKLLLSLAFFLGFIGLIASTLSFYWEWDYYYTLSALAPIFNTAIFLFILIAFIKKIDVKSITYNFFIAVVIMYSIALFVPSDTVYTLLHFIVPPLAMIIIIIPLYLLITKKEKSFLLFLFAMLFFSIGGVMHSIEPLVFQVCFLAAVLFLFSMFIPEKVGEERLSSLFRIEKELEEVKEKLSASEEMRKVLSDALKTSIDGIGMFDLKGKIIYSNDALAKIFGYEVGETRYENFSRFVSEDSKYIVKEVIPKALSGGWSGEMTGKRKDGKPFPIYVSISPVKGDNGNVRALMVLVRDITDKKRAEIELIKAKNEAEFYNDLMSHDINNFNQGTMGYLDLLLMSPNLDDKQREYLEKAISQVRGSAQLIDNVKKLNKAKSSQIRLRRVDLGEFFRDTIESIQTSFAEKDLKVNCNISEGNHFVMADELLYDLFSNILTNAIKYNDSDKIRIDIGIEEYEENGREYWKVSIADNGVGIPDESKDRIFNRFEREGCVKGSGLGLSIVKVIVDRYRGRVWVENKVKDDYSKGSVFNVLLPKG